MDVETKTTYNKSNLKTACSRSIKELNSILLNFLENEFDQLQAASKNLFLKLLSESDENLFQWLKGNSLPTDGKMHDLILYIRYFCS